MLRIGMLLCGCGALDGSDPTQVVTLRVAAARRGDVLLAFAPAVPQSDVIGTQGPLDGTRHALEESTRLTGGRIDPVDAVRADELDVLAVPGGLGVLKTLLTPAARSGLALAQDLLATGGALLVVDEGAVWAAAVGSPARVGEVLVPRNLAVGSDPDLEAAVLARGHRPDPARNAWVEDARTRVFSIALGGAPRADAVLDAWTDGLTIVEGFLRREADASA